MLLKELNVSRSHLAVRKEVPAAASPFREDRNPSLARRQLSEAGFLRYVPSSSAGPMQHNDGRPRSFGGGPLDQGCSRLPVDNELHRFSGNAEDSQERG